MNCSRYVGLSSFIFGDPVEPLKCPNNFIFNLTRCFVNDVTAFHTPPSPDGDSNCSAAVGVCTLSTDCCCCCWICCIFDVALRNNFFMPPPYKLAHETFVNRWPAKRYKMWQSQVEKAYTNNDMNVAINASHNSTFRRGVSSSFSRANNARKLVTPGHFDGDVLTVTGSSVEYLRRRWFCPPFALAIKCELWQLAFNLANVSMPGLW